MAAGGCQVEAGMKQGAGWRRGNLANGDGGGNSETLGRGGTQLGPPRVHHSMAASLGSGSAVSTMNSGSPLTPDPGSLIGCGEEHCRSRRGKEEGNLLPESCQDFKEKARVGELSCAKTIFCS